MNKVVEKIMDYISYNPKKALAVGLFSGAVISKLFKKGIFAVKCKNCGHKLDYQEEKEK